MGNSERFIRSGGRKRGITRVRQDQPVDYGIYATAPEERRRLNSSVNRLHVNRSRCS